MTAEPLGPPAEGPVIPGGIAGPLVVPDELALPVKRFTVDAVSALDLFFLSAMFGVVIRAALIYLTVGAFWVLVVLCRGLSGFGRVHSFISWLSPWSPFW